MAGGGGDSRHPGDEYPQAGHSFLNDHHSVVFKVLKVAGVGYHERAAVLPPSSTHLTS